MTKVEIINSFINGFEIHNADIHVHEFPKWSIYPKNHRDGIKELHSFEFNAIEQRVMWRYLKSFVGAAKV